MQMLLISFHRSETVAGKQALFASWLDESSPTIQQVVVSQGNARERKIKVLFSFENFLDLFIVVFSFYLIINI